MIGPAEVIVIVEVTGVPFTGTGCGLNEHTGGSVTSGVIDAHDSVTPPRVGSFGSVGLTYPFSGLMLIVPSAPLPAGTLVGATGVWIVMVNCGATDRTVAALLQLMGKPS